MKLVDQVRVARRFQRAIRIDADLGDPRALEGFVCPPSSADVLVSMARHVQDTGHAAFTWTGPYGSGKSSLVIALSALLNGNERLRREAAARIGQQAAKRVWTALPPRARGWRILPVVGRRADLATTIGEATVARGLVAKQAKRWSDPRVVEVVSDLARAHPRSEGGLVLVIDEMGKLLEAAAQDGADIYLLQQLAEAACRSGGRLLVVGILHQAFDEYAQRLARELRDEWAKVQGRFVDLVVNTTGDEQLDLLAQAIETTGRKPSVPGVAVVADVVRKNRATDRAFPKTLGSCWPLHPIVACLLGPLSRRRFGQNQRSLFGFLNSAEPFAFQDFLRSADVGTLYSPDLLWDYLRANLEPAILASPDGHRWSMAVEVVERSVGAGAREQHLVLLKTIALIDLFRERSGLVATPELLESALTGVPARDVKRVLRELGDWSLVMFRKHIGAYAIYAGSDFDIEAALSEAMATSREIKLRELRALAGLQPILAKRHYHETGALRWFDVDLVALSEVPDATARQSPEGGAMGRFVLVIPTEGESAGRARRACQEAAERAGGDAVIGLSGQAWHVMQLTREFLAMCRIQEERPELASDSVARREVLARVVELRASLESNLQRVFETAEWFQSGQVPRRYSVPELNALASEIADQRYPETPRLPNELVNRSQPSSNAVAAQKALLKSMVEGEGQVRLGIEGFPAEGGLFDSILLKSGLYRPDPDGSWRFRAPDPAADPCRLGSAWQVAIQEIRESSAQSVSVERLYKRWRAAPFGIKDGLLPILVVALILAERRRLAFYRDGVFQARFTRLEVEHLSIDPASIAIRWVDLAESPQPLLRGLASIVGSLSGVAPPPASQPIEVARGLVGVFETLKPWVIRTARLSRNAVTVRDLLRHASDPNRLLFDDIPNVLGGSDRSPDATAMLLDRVRCGLEELRSAYSQMLGRLRALLLAELQVSSASHHWVAGLRERAANVHQLSGDFRLNAFVGRLAQFTDTEADLEGIASLAVSKPPRDWVDADLDQAQLEMAELAQRFNRAEAFARVQGRTDKRQAMAVVVGMRGRPTPVSGEFDITESEREAVDDVIARVRLALETSDQGRRNVILAALAEVSARYLSQAEGQSVGTVPLRKDRR